MFRSTTVLALAATLLVPVFSSSAAACNHRRVTYYSQPVVTRVIHSVRTVQQPKVVVKPVTYSNVAYVTKAAEILVKPSNPALIVGSTVTASANFLGKEPGFVFVQLDSATLQCEVIEWTANSVTFKTPNLGLRNPTMATLELVRPDGRIVREFKIDLEPKAALAQHIEPKILAVPANTGSAEIRSANASGLSLEAPSAPLADASILITR